MCRLNKVANPDAVICPNPAKVLYQISSYLFPLILSPATWKYTPLSWNQSLAYIVSVEVLCLIYILYVQEVLIQFRYRLDNYYNFSSHEIAKKKCSLSPK